MDSPYETQLARIARRLEEIRLWRHAMECPVRDWTFISSKQEYSLKLGDFWPVVETPVRMKATAVVPAEWKGKAVNLELWLGGEGFVSLSNGVKGGLDPFHRTYKIADVAEGGESIDINAEVVPKGMFGQHVREPRIEWAQLIVPQQEVIDLDRDLTMILEASRQLGNHEVVPYLIGAAEEALAIISRAWPSNTEVTVRRLQEGYENPIGNGVTMVPLTYLREAIDINPFDRVIWNFPWSDSPAPPLPLEAVEAINEARKTLRSRLEEIKEKFPPHGAIALTGHAHIDLAWLWPLAETHRKVRRTWWSVVNLMKTYEDFTFNQSSAQAYEWMEHEDPELFGEIQKLVKEGRWEPVGGSWCESDCQITGGESFVRQLFYGQRYFQEKFGVRNEVAWLPDVFGFSGGIPQLLRGAGIKNFFTIKLTWNDTNQFPYHLFWWEGIDGSKVKAHIFYNPGQGYNGHIAPLDILGTWRNYKAKTLHPETLLAFGWGDGGGGPSARMLDNYQRLKDFPAMPRLRMAHVEDYFASLPDALPKWSGELYLEFHRGVYTSQAKQKELNRASEHRLLEAEMFAAIASRYGYTYPKEQFDAVWKDLLLCQFHDILPGSSIHEVYQDSHRMLENVISIAEAIRNDALAFIANADSKGNEAHSVLIANTSLKERPLTLVVRDLPSGATLVDQNGNTLPYQQVDEGVLIHAPKSRIPACGWQVFQTSSEPSGEVEVEDQVSVKQAGEKITIENEYLFVEIDADGTLSRVYDKEVDREVLQGKGNQIWAYVDKPRMWDAWELEANYTAEGAPIDQVDSIEVLEAGPLRVAVKVDRSWRSSKVTQIYRLLSSSRRLDIETHIDWHERNVILKAHFPLMVHTRTATYETMYGVHQRPTHRNTSWDAAKFEVVAHRFVDLSETDYGVAILNNAKYGYGVLDSEVSVTLLKSAVYPDVTADEGEHKFIYSLYPHIGDWTEANVVEEAFWLNSPLVSITTSGQGSNTSRFSLITSEGLPLAVGAVKVSEDGSGLIVRLYEHRGARGTAILSCGLSPSSVQRVNLLEEPDTESAQPKLDDGKIVLSVRPFEVISLRLEF